MDLVTWKKMRPLHQAQAKALIDKEVAGSLSKDKDYPYSGVMGKMLRRPERDYAFALGILRLRTDLQSDVLQIFHLLLERNFIIEETLIHPINLNTTDANVGRVLCTLRCFEEWRIDQFNNLGPDFIFDAPLKWLAIIIVRSNSEYHSLFTYLKDAKVLGEFNEHDYQRIRGALGEWTAGNGEKVATECLTDPRPFGFVLPIQGVQEVQNAIPHAASRLLSITELCCEIGTATLQDIREESAS